MQNIIREGFLCTSAHTYFHPEREAPLINMHIDSNACSVMHDLSLTCFRFCIEYWFWWSKESSLWISLDCIMYVKTYRRSGLFSIKYPDSNYDSGRNHLSGFLWITFSNKTFVLFCIIFHSYSDNCPIRQHVDISTL